MKNDYMPEYSSPDSMKVIEAGVVQEEIEEQKQHDQCLEVKPSEVTFPLKINTYENGMTREDLKKREDEQVQEIRANLEVSVENKKESLLNPEKEKEIREICLQIKEKIKDPTLSQKVKDLLLDAEVVGVLTGFKPASYIQPSMERKFLGFIKQNNGLSVKELKKFNLILEEFGVKSHFQSKDDSKACAFRKKYSLELIQIYEPNNLIEKMQKSGLFSGQEIEMVKKYPGDFWDGMTREKIGYASVARVGALYGYALEDVLDFIKTNQLKEKSISEKLDTKELAFLKRMDEDNLEIHIKGIKGSIDWKSTNPESLEVARTVAVGKRIFEIQEEIMSK